MDAPAPVAAGSRGMMVAAVVAYLALATVSRLAVGGKRGAGSSGDEHALAAAALAPHATPATHTGVRVTDVSSSVAHALDVSYVGGVRATPATLSFAICNS